MTASATTYQILKALAAAAAVVSVGKSSVKYAGQSFSRFIAISLEGAVSRNRGTRAA